MRYPTSAKDELKPGTKVKMKSRSSCTCKTCAKWAGKVVTFEKYRGKKHFHFEEDDMELKVKDIESLYIVPDELFEI